MTRTLRIPVLLLAVFLFGITPVMAAGQSSTAVAAEGEASTALVSKVAARAPYFLFFDDHGTLIEAQVNPHRQSGGGAGPLVVDFLVVRGVRIVIAGEFGPKMIEAMKVKEMTFRTATGSAADAVKAVMGK